MPTSLPPNLYTLHVQPLNPGEKIVFVTPLPITLDTLNIDAMQIGIQLALSFFQLVFSSILFLPTSDKLNCSDDSLFKVLPPNLNSLLLDTDCKFPPDINPAFPDKLQLLSVGSLPIKLSELPRGLQTLKIAKSFPLAELDIPPSVGYYHLITICIIYFLFEFCLLFPLI